MSSTRLAENIIALIEELYLVERSETEWIKGILNKAREFLDRGAGVGGVLYKLAPREHLIVQRFTGANLADYWLQVGEVMHTAPQFVTDQERIYRTLQCATLQECIRGALAGDVAAELYRNGGVAGVTLINGLSPTGEGCALYILSPRNDPLSNWKRQLLCRLSSHIATANRLRCRLDASGRRIDETTADAVLSASGKVEHARAAARSGESRQDIQRAFNAREWARGRARTDPERASLAWQGLVRAKWSLIDHFENDGKRYVLAQENSIAVVGLTLFSARERECLALALQGRPNKSIAYELGVANATVRVLMSRAARKVGARSRRELLQTCRSFLDRQAHSSSAR
jgi:DNA-binding CsgD family transcriptional regulator